MSEILVNAVVNLRKNQLNCLLAQQKKSGNIIAFSDLRPMSKRLSV
jgi:hypothetical protein